VGGSQVHLPNTLLGTRVYGPDGVEGLGLVGASSGTNSVNVLSRIWFLCRSNTRAGGKDKLGSISKQGDRYLRSLFTAGALAVIRYAKIHGTKHRPWLTALLARRPTKVAAIALTFVLALEEPQVRSFRSIKFHFGGCQIRPGAKQQSALQCVSSA
jgi:hypothetical protein